MRAPQETNRAELYLQTHGRSGWGETADSESSEMTGCLPWSWPCRRRQQPERVRLHS